VLSLGRFGSSKTGIFSFPSSTYRAGDVPILNALERGCRTDVKLKYFLGTRNLLLSQFFHFFCPITVSIFCRICLHIPISDTVQTVHELPLLPNNTALKHFYTNRERCEVLSGYLSLGRQPGGDWVNT